jgi:hypothetical protein
VDYVQLSAFLGDAESQMRWEAAAQDKAQLASDCQVIAETEPATRTRIESSKSDLDAFFAAAEAEEKRLEREQAAAQAAEDRKVRQFYEAAARAEEQRQIDEYLRAVAAENAAQEREAHRQGDALVRRLCGGSTGWYSFYINPVRVWLDRCDRNAGGGGGDLDCEDIGYEFEIDPWDDPNGLDGDGDGIAWGESRLVV